MSKLANFHLEAEIGKGSYGIVYRAEWNGKSVAAKILHKALFESHPGYAAVFKAECRKLQGLQHKNVVRLLGLEFSNSSPPMLITELLDSDLGDYIEHLPGKIPYPEAVSFALDVAEGLNYLHQLKPPMVHRDLAPKNILVTFKNGPKIAKIADLGLAKCFPPNQNMFATPVPGTPAYCAPETYTDKPGIHQAEYSAKIDIFSYGVTVMEMINGSPPKMEPECPLEKGLCSNILLFSFPECNHPSDKQETGKMKVKVGILSLKRWECP